MSGLTGALRRLAERAQAGNVGRERAHHGKAQRRRAEHHRALRYPQRRRQIGRGAIVEAERGELESRQLPQQQHAESKRENIEYDVGNCAGEWREARLDQLDVVKAVVDLAYRQADEGDHHQHVTAELIRNLEGKVEERPRQYIDADHDQHDDQCRDASELAGPFDNAFPELWRRRTAVAAALLDLYHYVCWDLSTKRGPHLCQRLDDVGTARLRPFVPVRFHRRNRASILLRCRLGEGVSGGGEHLHRFRLFLLHRLLVPARGVLRNLAQLALQVGRERVVSLGVGDEVGVVDVDDQDVAVFEQVLPQHRADAGGENAVDHAAVERRGDFRRAHGDRGAAEAAHELALLRLRDAKLHALDIVERLKFLAPPNEL